TPAASPRCVHDTPGFLCASSEDRGHGHSCRGRHGASIAARGLAASAARASATPARRARLARQGSGTSRKSRQVRFALTPLDRERITHPGGSLLASGATLWFCSMLWVLVRHEGASLIEFASPRANRQGDIGLRSYSTVGFAPRSRRTRPAIRQAPSTA